ncbi:hypothetical protein THAOC_22076, partial [Thalassiosira oceanica]
MTSFMRLFGMAGSSSLAKASRTKMCLLGHSPSWLSLM